MSTRSITIKGAREHNLKDISIKLPRDKFIVITGISGSGKSTLAFDTLYAEGQRRYVESLSAYARQFLGVMSKPDLDSIEGISPAIAIEQKTTSKNPRSTVGTVTEIYDYLRLLFARIGIPHCPEHGIEIVAQSPERIAKRIAEELGGGEGAGECEGADGLGNGGESGGESGGEGESKNGNGSTGSTGSVIILSPIVRQKKGTYEKLISDLHKEGYTRARVNREIHRTDEKIELERYKKHDIEIVIDRLNTDDRSRLAEAVENALQRSDGLVIAIDKDGCEHTYSSKMACPICGIAFEELQPRMFSFNSPFGACPLCHGLGITMDFDCDLIIPDKSQCIADGALAIYRNAIDGWRGQYVAAVAKHSGFDIFTPINDLTEEQFDVLMYGTDESIRFNMTMRDGDAEWSHTAEWEGLLPQCERLYQQTNSEYRRHELERFMRIAPCPGCGGKRLKETVLAVTVGERSIIDITDMSINACIEFFKDITLTEKELEIAGLILKEIVNRLDFLVKVGLGYLTLSRAASTLSGGEAQRIRLATQIGANLMGVLYILDEPSIGLHQRDNQKLIDTLHRLRDIGNTLIVVEHDEETIRKADYVVDMGPGAGVHGGWVVAEGTPEEIEANPESLTGKYLSGQLSIATPEIRRTSRGSILIKGCRQNNLKNIDVAIPTGVLTLVTGVSGSGKSTLIYEILYRGLMQQLHGSRQQVGLHDEIVSGNEINKVLVIDQSPIGKTPRSNPATYTKVFDEIRKIFSGTKEAKIRGFKPGRFSFNVHGGRCEACSGDGVIKIEMNFLPDVYVECEECRGARYNNETLEVKYKGKTIADVLDMTALEALDLFGNVPTIRRKLETLIRVGLGYIKLGQRSTTLSGGEAQRIKLTKELSKRDTGRTLYLLDEPTTGLHFHDVRKLIEVLNDLVKKGNTVVVIEHNLDVIKSADHIIDLGPEGGDGGGLVVATGTPEEVAASAGSYTGEFLKGILSGT